AAGRRSARYLPSRQPCRRRHHQRRGGGARPAPTAIGARGARGSRPSALPGQAARSQPHRAGRL
ncbi:MAG: hypothetical protein AVDCRST_MAG50-1990, partial [uncultured Acidimicrobiales bacterium]